MEHNGYTLITSIVRNNVLGAVIAPRGTEHYPKDKRFLVWRSIIRPLVDEVAEREEFPREDAKYVMQELAKFCKKEGIIGRIDGEDDPEVP